MPNKDGNGPPGTGPNCRGMGTCRFGIRTMRMGRERGMGRGGRNRSPPDAATSDGRSIMEAEVIALEVRLRALKERLSMQENDSS
ncbi:MAG: DUF5320 domain-containing protein [Methanomassiliicoccales archaeon]|nr:DUF5320 domain-containing protein [Methanomassiliicoccales archaeon]